LVTLVSCGPPPPYKEKYFDQKLDHFNYAYYKNGTYKQRYLIQADSWDAGGLKGPIFFYTGNEGGIEGFYDNCGFIMEIAQQFRALIIFAEHRFYGKSLPFGAEKSFQWPHLGLLTVDQALADFANLITSLKKDLKCQSASGADMCPVITFGGSYGGMLAAYMRFKYPNVVEGAIAASAPLRLADTPSKRTLFWAEVTKDFFNVNKKSPQVVRQAFIDLHSAYNRGDLSLISRVFRLCRPLASAKDFRHLLLFVRNAFTLLTMMDYPYPTSFMVPLPGHPVAYAADLIMKADTPMEGLYQATAVVYNGTHGTLPCFDMYDLYIKCADPTGCGKDNDARAWDFQACYQIALAYGSTNVTDMFPELPWTDEMKKDYCMKTWQVEPDGDEYAVRYWGSDVFSSSNIVFSNGDLDPWGSAGILDPNALNPTIIPVPVIGGAHHLDLRPDHPLDPPGVREARAKEIFAISSWIKDFGRRQR